jgi:AraC-like DNA-binding protein
VTVRDVTARVGLSHRRFVEVFATEVGLTPKRFHRVRRLQHLLAVARHATTPKWNRLAVDGGFFDLSHLIHEVVKFSGFTPARLARHLHELREREVHLKRNHLPLIPAGVQLFPKQSASRGEDGPRRPIDTGWITVCVKRPLGPRDA